MSSEDEEHVGSSGRACQARQQCSA